MESYNELGSMNTRVIRKWYHLGRSFERQVEAMKNQKRKRKSEQTARKDLYDKMMKLLVKEDMNIEEKNRKRDALKEKVQGAVKIYELLINIGEEKINNIRETYVSTIIKFTESEIDKVFKGIKKENQD